jgi:hypothetical protein
VLLVENFNGYYEPNNARAALAVRQAAGYNVRIVPAGARIQRLSSRHHLARLFERAHLCLVHVDHHRLDDRPLAKA